MNSKSGVRYWAALICAGIVSILFLIIYVITIIIAYKYSGLFAAVASAFLPCISQIYWGYKIWANSGIFFNLYNITFIIIIGFTVLCKILRPDFFDN